MAVCPEFDPASPLQFVINAAAGSSDADAKRAVIETALRAGGRRGELLFCSPAQLARVAHKVKLEGNELYAMIETWADHIGALGTPKLPKAPRLRKMRNRAGRG